MKITLNKHEYAAVIRNCMSAVEYHNGCGKCVLNGICCEPDMLENMCNIVEAEEVIREAVNDISNLQR